MQGAQGELLRWPGLHIKANVSKSMLLVLTEFQLNFDRVSTQLLAEGYIDTCMRDSAPPAQGV